MIAAFLAQRRFVAALLVTVSLLPGCASHKAPEVGQRAPEVRQPQGVVAHPVAYHHRTLEGAGIGAAAGAAGAILIGKRAAADVLLGAAIGGVAGGAVGAYLDAQERKLTHIPGATVERVDADTLLVRFDSDVLFPVGSARPTAESLATLGEVGDVLVQYRRTAVVVQGHTDSTGSLDYNQGLSEMRANAVRELLIDRGVEPGRIVAIGHGESYPVASNGFEEGRRRNRRVTILLRSRGA